MALDKLRPHLDKLCELLSRDPDNILLKCGDLLTMNQSKRIQNQSCALEKMKMLLETISQSGEDSQQSFVDILRQLQAHNNELKQFFNSTEESTTATMYVDAGSVCIAREMENIKGKSVNINIEMVGGSGSSQSGNCSGHVPPAKCTVTGGSFVCVDKISNAKIDGDINLTVTMSSAQVHTGKADETLPSSEGPAVKLIKKNKPELIDCLMGDCSLILQYVESEDIVAHNEYVGLKENPQSEKTIRDLIDLLMGKGQEACSRFLRVLQKPEILKTFPRLKNMELQND